MSAAKLSSLFASAASVAPAQGQPLSVFAPIPLGRVVASLGKPSQPTTAKSIMSGDYAKGYGAIICWRNVKNGAEISTHEEGHQESAVLSSIARLVNRGLDLRQWKLQTVSTPQRIFHDTTHGRRSKHAKPDRYEGKTALQILADAGR